MFSSKLQRDKVRSVLLNPNAFATSLIILVVDNYGTEAFEWDPMTLRNELIDDFNLGKLPNINFDKIQAAITLITSDSFYNDWLAFNSICEAFNDDPIDFLQLDPVTPEQAAWGVVEASLLDDGDDVPEYNSEVRAYIGVILNMHGITRKPKTLKMARMPDNVDAGIESFSDDQTQYLGYYGRQQSDMEHIDTYVRGRFTDLTNELDALPLQSRDNETWTKYLTAVKKSGLLLDS